MVVSQLRDVTAVLFDMDGTLVDSEKLWSIGLEELARYLGGEISPEARWSMVGTSMAVSMGILHEDLGKPWLDPTASVTWLEDRMKDLFADGLEWRPGARELLVRVRDSGLPMALVTSTSRQLVEVALRTIGPDLFSVVVVGDEVEHAKPHPYPYLKAAAGLGVDPARCVVIEDSPSGVASAVAAGCAVLAVPCEVDIAARDGVTVLPSLVDVDLPYLLGLGSRG
jgi:HAD superfamily hydrolase (TIGR01509 family)